MIYYFMKNAYFVYNNFQDFKVCFTQFIFTIIVIIIYYYIYSIKFKFKSLYNIRTNNDTFHKGEMIIK